MGRRGKSADGDGAPGPAGDSTAGDTTELDDDYWLGLWAFGTSRDGLGLTAETLWGLSSREYRALERQWAKSREWQTSLLATLRADLHNTSAREFNRVFEAADFLPGASTAIEQRVAELVEQGYTPSQAAAIATSRQSRDRQIHLIDRASRKPKRPKRAG